MNKCLRPSSVFGGCGQLLHWSFSVYFSLLLFGFYPCKTGFISGCSPFGQAYWHWLWSVICFLLCWWATVTNSIATRSKKRISLFNVAIYFAAPRIFRSVESSTSKQTKGSFAKIRFSLLTDSYGCHQPHHWRLASGASRTLAKTIMNLVEVVKDDLWKTTTAVAVYRSLLVQNCKNFLVLAFLLVFKLFNDALLFRWFWVAFCYFTGLSAFAVLSYARFTFQIDQTSVLVNKGLFIQKQTILPFERIQTIQENHYFYLRPFKLAEVKLESAASSSGEAEILFPALPLALIASIEASKGGCDTTTADCPNN